MGARPVRFPLLLLAVLVVAVVTLHDHRTALRATLVATVLAGAIVRDRAHAATLRHSGVDSFGDWRHYRRRAAWFAIATAVISLPYLFANHIERVVVPLAIVGSAAVVTFRASKRSERHERSHGRAAD